MRRSALIATRLALAGLSALAWAACADRDPVAVPAPPPEQPSLPVILASVRCTAETQSGALSCAGAELPASARGYIIVGGQDQYVHIGTTNGGYNGTTHVFSFDLTVQNLIPQPMGTTDGATPDANGVRVIVASGPNVTAGSGS
ncbi:MAG TPA: hypothetical protein VF771_17825, partial [Longimicrobiaceae bacterium]